MVAADGHVNGRMHFDAPDLGSGKVLLVVDMVDMVILDHGEYAAQMTHDTGLAAVMDIASADDMGADPLLRPAFPPGLANGVPLCLGTVLIVSGGPFVVVLRLQIFAKRDAAASGIRDLAVLYDPALRPVGPDHPFLICRRRSPLRCRLLYGKTGQRNIPYSRPGRIEAVPSDVDLHLLFIGICSLKFA